MLRSSTRLCIAKIHEIPPVKHGKASSSSDGLTMLIVQGSRTLIEAAAQDRLRGMTASEAAPGASESPPHVGVVARWSFEAEGGAQRSNLIGLLQMDGASAAGLATKGRALVTPRMAGGRHCGVPRAAGLRIILSKTVPPAASGFWASMQST